ncbi:MAG: MFS transporter, partial [Alphaproteobacteria bacterium]|nr:MFS transporter [Alphaproteobacteria bacterium]
MRPTPFAWALAGLCFLLGLASRGLCDTFSVFVPAIEAEAGLSRAAVASIYAFAMIGIGFGGPFVGWLFDRFGPRRLVLAGLFACAGAFASAAHAEALWQFRLGLGLLLGAGVVALGAVLQSALLARWFRERLTTAVALGYSANGAGVLLFSPLAQALIDAGGVRFAYQVLALALAALSLPIAFLPWRRIAAGDPRFPTLEAASGEGPGLGAALGGFPFWGLTWAFGFTSVGIYGLTPQVVAYLQDRGFGALEAASLYGLTGLLMPIGMIGTGMIADRFGRRLAVALAYGGTLGGILCLALVEGPGDAWLVVAFALLFGATMGSRGPVIAALAARHFRGREFGRIYGSITMGMGLGGASGAWLG